MNPTSLTHTYAPRITFQDTNVVGNVYFLTFFRWQGECRDQWLRDNVPDLWTKVRSGERQLLVTHWSTRFEDPLGATIGDDVDVSFSVPECVSERVSATVEIFRLTGNGAIRIASGSTTFTTHGEISPPHDDHPTGPCYSFDAHLYSVQPWHPLDLLSWQGKCRELFLADHAAATLRLVADRKLILQTTHASFDLLQPPPAALRQVRVEMRLETLKCGQMGVRFDYFADLPSGGIVRIAKGSQKLSAKHHSGPGVVPCPFPTDLLLALREFTDSTHLLGKVDDIISFSSIQRTAAAVL